MRYLSKGMVCKQSMGRTLRVTRCGADYMLTGVGERLWLDGRFGVRETEDARELRHLRELERLGLITLSEERGCLGDYRMLAQCVICPAAPRPVRAPLSRAEKRVWTWIEKAALRLTIGELTKLIGDGVLPAPHLLGRENAQELTLLIYADDLTFDTTPDLRMEASPARDGVVNAVLGLLRKKRIILI